MPRFLALLVAPFCLAGCLDKVPLPQSYYPAPSFPEIKYVEDPGATSLQCLSQELRPFANDKANYIMVGTGALASKVAEKIGEIAIPRSLKDQATTAISNIQNSIQYIWAPSPFDQTVFGQGGHVVGPQDYPVPIGTLFIGGGINYAQQEALSQRDIEILGPGDNSKVQKFVISTHFEMINFPGGELLGIPVDIKMTFYQIDRGMSLFVITNLGLLRGEDIESRTPSMVEAFQKLTDIGVAALLRQAAVYKFRITPTWPPNCLVTPLYVQDTPPVPSNLVQVDVGYSPERGFCATVTASAASTMKSKSVEMIWLQYIGAGRLIKESRSSETIDGTSPAVICFPIDQQHPATTTMDVKVLDADKNQIGAGSVRLPLSP